MPEQKLVLKILGDAKSGVASLKEMTSGVSGFTKTAAAMGAGMLAAGIGIEKSLSGTRDKALEYGSAVLKVKRLTGDSAAESSIWVSVMNRAGIEGQKSTLMMTKLAKAIDSDSEGLKSLGIATKDSEGKNRDHMDVLKDLADAYQNSDDKQHMLAVTSEILGKGVGNLSAVFAGGREKIDEWAQSAQDTGKILTDTDLKAVADYNGALKENQEVLEGVKIQTGLATLPVETFKNKAILGVMKALRDVNPELPKFAGGVGSVAAPLLKLGGGALIAVSTLPLLKTGLAELGVTLDATAIAGAAATLAVQGLGIGAAAAVGFGIGTLITKIPVVNDQLTQLGTNLAGDDDKFNSFERWMYGLGDAVDDGAGSAGNASEAIKGLAGSEDGATKATQEATAAFQAQTLALDPSRSNLEAVTGDVVAWHNAQKALADYLKGGGKKSGAEYNQLLQQSQDALQLTAQQVATMTDAEITAAAKSGILSKGMAAAAKIANGLTGEQKDLGSQLIIAAGKVDTLQAKLKTVPASKRTELKAEIDKSKENVQTIKDKIAGLHGRTLSVKVNMTGGGKLVGGPPGWSNIGWHMQSYALGGILKAQSGGRIVRVVEDRDDEAIIPINNRPRSLALLQETARRMGVMSGGGNVFNISGEKQDADYIAVAVRRELSALLIAAGS